LADAMWALMSLGIRKLQRLESALRVLTEALMVGGLYPSLLIQSACSKTLAAISLGITRGPMGWREGVDLDYRLELPKYKKFALMLPNLRSQSAGLERDGLTYGLRDEREPLCAQRLIRDPGYLDLYMRLSHSLRKASVIT
jgi:hypothetical protein